MSVIEAPVREEIHLQIFEWNDDPDRTEAEVISLLRKGAEYARQHPEGAENVSCGQIEA